MNILVTAINSTLNFFLATLMSPLRTKHVSVDIIKRKTIPKIEHCVCWYFLLYLVSHFLQHWMLLEELPKYARASVFDKMTLCAMWCKQEDSLHCGQFTKFPSGGFTRAAIMKPPDGNLVKPNSVHWYTIDQAAWMSTSRKVSKVDFPAMPVLLFWGASCMYAGLCYSLLKTVMLKIYWKRFQIILWIHEAAWSMVYQCTELDHKVEQYQTM